MRRPLLSLKQILLLLSFTFTETEILTYWLYLIFTLFTPEAGLIYTSPIGILAQLALFIGLLLEHLQALIAGDYPQKGAVVTQGLTNG